MAYADFVTAMMALFLVLWLTSQDEKIKEAVERAFKNPFMSVTKQSVGIIASKDTQQAVENKSGNFDSASAVELSMLRRLNQDLTQSLQSSDEEMNNNVRLDLSPEGLRISIFDRSRKAIFKPDSVDLTQYGTWVFSTLAWQISRYGNFTVELEGHTETGTKQKSNIYGPWELSTDRAHTGRRTLIEHGVKSLQIAKIAGFADTVPMPNTPPEDEINRRVTVMLKVNNKIK